MSVVSDGVTPDTSTPLAVSERVLIVEDDAALRQTITESLESAGFAAAQAVDAADALERLKAFAYDAMVVDLLLPDASGMEVLEEAVTRYPQLPVVVITGFGGVEEAVKAMKRGAVDFLIKPVSRHVLYAKVKALLELDRSFSKLREEAAKFHERQLQAAREAEIRQREELIFTQRRERLTNIFAEASIDLGSLEKAIVTEFSHLFDADCVLRLTSPGHGWHDSLSHSGSARPSRNRW